MFSKPLLARLGYSLFKIPIKRLREISMGKMHCETTKSIVFFIWQCHTPLAIFHHYETTLMLLKPQWNVICNQFLMVEWSFKFGLAIEKTITNLEWTTFVNTLHGTHHHKYLTKARYVRANIRRDASQT